MSTASNATRDITGGTEYGVAFQVDDQSTDPFALITFEDYKVKTRYQVVPPTAPVPAPNDAVETVVREGAQRMLQRALEAEVKEFLDRDRCVRTVDFRGCRNGHLPERAVGTGMGAVSVRMPTVSRTPEGVDRFHSEIVDRYQPSPRRSNVCSRACTSKGVQR
jgi:hypothetical protein